MWRVVFYFLIAAAIAAGFAWFAERPGEVTLTWLGYEIETSLFAAMGLVIVVVGLLLALWAFIRAILGMPGLLTGIFRIRRRRLGYEALSKGMLAAGAGDAKDAQKFANQASRWLSGEPLTLMLKAQAAQLRGDEVIAERVFRAMLQMPETELLGLHGLFIQARRKSDGVGAKSFAEQAFVKQPALPWAARAVLMLQSSSRDWRAAEQTLSQCKKSRLITAREASRKQAVILCARAMEAEETDDAAALEFARKAHKLAPGLVPSAVIAGRILAARGKSLASARLLAKTWRLSPHPDIAEVYAAARGVEGPRERLKRLRALLKKSAGGDEGAIALAGAAIDAKDWRVARAALAPLLSERLSARVCALMARIEEGEFGDKGKVREWLSRALHAKRDPVWMADGVVSHSWLPISPVTGELDQFEWKAPLEAIGAGLDDPAWAASFVEDGSEVDGEKSDEHLDAPNGDVKNEDEIVLIEESAIAAADAIEAEAAPEDQDDKPDRVKEPVVFVPPPAPDDPGSADENKSQKHWLRSLLAR